MKHTSSPERRYEIHIVARGGDMTFFASPRRNMSSCQAASNHSEREILLKYRIRSFIIAMS